MPEGNDQAAPADPARYRSESAEVLYTADEVATVTAADLAGLKAIACDNPRRRARLCAHHSPADQLHEMLIVLDKSAYVRPHRHPGKTESTHIVEGRVDVVVFSDEGEVTRVIELGDYQSGRAFYYRMSAPLFHTLLIRSDMLVFHETTSGPFDRKDTVLAPWAPAEPDALAVGSYLSDLEKRIRREG